MGEIPCIYMGVLNSLHSVLMSAISNRLLLFMNENVCCLELLANIPMPPHFLLSPA